jgi:hypothetical protein
MHQLRKYKDKKVIVRADGITYKGVLKEVTEEGVFLKCLTGWVEVPMEKITSIRAEDEKEQKNDSKFVDKSFWDFPPEEK